MPVDFNQIITDAAQDLQTDSDLETLDTTQPDSQEPVQEVTDTPEATSTEVADPEVTASTDTIPDLAETPQGVVPTPAVTAALDAFAKEHGLPQPVPGQKENRIPYSRVQTITANAVKKAMVPLEGKVKEFTEKVQDYEGRLGKVAEFEKLMAEEPIQFLNLLATIPSYKTLFDQLAQGSAQPAVTAQPADPYAGMPAADGPDGSYTQDGVKALMKWNAEQTTKQVLEQVTTRYKPFEEERERKEYMEKVVAPKITADIDRISRKPLFKETQPEIERLLNEDKTGTVTLQDAYDTALFNHLKADRDKLRKEWIAESQKAPKATAVTGGATKPTPAASNYNGIKSMADIIRDAAQADGLID